MIGNNSKIFVDTSAFYALIDRSDRYHSQASALWPELLDDGIELITSNYVVWETVGLLQKRIGFAAASVSLLRNIYQPHEIIVECFEPDYITRLLGDISVAEKANHNCNTQLLFFGGGTQFYSFPLIRTC